jgi:hypothetical protein
VAGTACKMLDLCRSRCRSPKADLDLPEHRHAMCREDGSTPDELLKTAGNAMRRARDQQTRYAFGDARAEIWASQFSTLRG